MSDDREISIRWSKPGQPIHLVRNICDACAVWCKANHYDDGACDDPEDATCADCLDEARRYGGQAHKRAEELRRGLAT
jgi:hypothetical protein